MKILITGATGLIGSELSKLLIGNQHTVHYLTTSKDKIKNKPNYNGFYWNPEKNEIDVNCLVGVDAIIHLAGASISKRWTTSYKKEIIESRTQSAKLLLDMISNNPNTVQQIISASGTASYPESYTTVYDENTIEKEDSFLSEVVTLWESSIDQFKPLIPIICKIRTGVVLAKNGGALPEMAKPIKYGFGAVMGNGKQVQSWIHLEDLVQLYYFALTNKLEGVYNAVSPNPVSNEEMTNEIAKQLGKTIWLPNVPEFMMKMILGEMSYLLFSSKNLRSEKIQNLGFKFKFKTIQEALQNIYK